MKFPKFYLGKMIEEKQRNEGLLGTIFFLMEYLRWGRGDNATGIQPIDFGKVGSLGRFILGFANSKWEFY